MRSRFKPDAQFLSQRPELLDSRLPVVRVEIPITKRIIVR
jgi:hypothetical protein